MITWDLIKFRLSTNLKIVDLLVPQREIRTWLYNLHILYLFSFLLLGFAVAYDLHHQNFKCIRTFCFWFSSVVFELRFIIQTKQMENFFHTQKNILQPKSLLPSHYSVHLPPHTPDLKQISNNDVVISQQLIKTEFKKYCMLWNLTRTILYKDDKQDITFDITKILNVV